ncbi:sugar nucleotide-binding protein [Mariniblastus fucicola]|uniref:dTDP-4-dehydrorhamnose reductase n=1 Tax=Mariniblastus fucicola TaxID=980251 RepID=A0A5B9P472_9BACT|nr:sugar nucleotide-binding protein [Mariniblastus fucicola]QEG20289.1 RmlD substrate binding domain protein [Mariniblastus fucicola]
MIALLGSTGYVGKYFAKHLADQNIDFLTLSRSDTAGYSVDSLAAKLRKERVDFLICAAGFTGKPNVDACEIQKSECIDGNAVLPGFLSRVAADVGIRWGHVSSGCIYNGESPSKDGFKETDAPNFSFRTNNCSFYSGTKALGEEVLADDRNCFVWRLRIPFSNVDSPRNYLSKLMRYDRLLEARNSLSNLDDYVRACLKCVTGSVPTGVYNLTNPGSVTTRQVVEKMLELGVAKGDFSFFDDEAAFMISAAKTPRSNCVLNSQKAVDAGLEMPDVLDSIERSLQNWQSECEKK